MKLATFLAPGASDPTAGEVRGDTVVAFSSGTVLDRLQSGDRAPADGPQYPLADVTLLAPVPRPAAIFCIGLNYLEHAKETGNDLPEVPMVFLKLPRSSVPPNGTVEVPQAAMGKLDYEVELVVVIGGDGRPAGYAVGDDLSARDLQGAEPRWVRGKGFDSSCPWGPWVTTADEVPDPENLRIQSHVNGESRQDSNTNDLIFKIPQIVDFIAETCTLEAGAIILTGTPQGVGHAMDPMGLLSSGDTVRCEVEGLGVIEHTIA